MNEIIQNEYRLACINPSDINEHLPKLKELADECEIVTEFGVREIVSTWALLNSNAKKVISYDIHAPKNLDYCRKYAPHWTFFQSDVLKVIIEETDMLFIDTLHQYTQLKNELFMHSNKVNKYLVFHDTTTYAHTPEPADWQSKEIMQNFDSTPNIGIWDAIKEFLEENKQWSLLHRFNNNNGLTILKKTI